MTHNLRAERTRRVLQSAMVELVIERGYDALNVQDLLDRARVARSSFYAHFRDKEDLLLSGFGDFRSPPDPVHSSLHDYADWLFGVTEQSIPLTRTLMSGSSREVVLQHLRNAVIVHMREWLKHRMPAPRGAVETEATVQYLTGALMGMWTWWMQHDFSAPASEMAALFDRNAQYGFGALTGVPS